MLDTSTICAGHPDEKYVSMLEAKKGKRVIASDGCTSAYLDEQGQVTLNGHVYPFTVRSAGCEILCHGSKCHSCMSYRSVLRTMYTRWITHSPSRHTATSSTTNFRYLSTLEKAERYKELKVRSLSERLTQDPLECFLGKQRACGGRNENPSARQFLDNTVSLRVQGSAALDPVRGNCRKKKRIKKNTQSVIDETPLPKRRRKSHTAN